MNSQQRAAMKQDPYNGDDGPGFDYEFHAKLCAGEHLMSEKQREFFNIGWKAGREFEREALAQPQGEPVAWLVSVKDESELGHWFAEQQCEIEGHVCQPLYTTPPVVPQEPVAWINWSALTGERRLGWQCESEIASEPLYTTPPSVQAAIEATKEKVLEMCHVEYPDDYAGGSDYEAGRLNALREIAAAIRSIK